MPTYKTFLRSARNWREFANSEKITQDEGLTYEEARSECEEYNKNRTENEIEAGTKLEFTEE